MPIEKKFKSGSIVYFEHEVGNTIYVVKNGRMDISYIQPESGVKLTKTLGIGEFFGLKSAIIDHTRDEIVESVSDSVAIEFKKDEFEKYVSKNVELLKRLLRVLSNQLRALGTKVNNYLGNNIVLAPNIGLFKIGEYYINNRQYKQAIQVFERYIKNYSQTVLVGEAKERIKICEEAINTGYAQSFKSLDEIMLNDSSGKVYAVSSPSPLPDGEDVRSDAFRYDRGDEEGGAAEEEEKPVTGTGIKAFMEKYYTAESFYVGKDYEQAELAFFDLINTNFGQANEDLLQKAKVMYVDTLFNLGKFQECSKEISEFIQKSKSVSMNKKMLFVLADIYHQLNNQANEKAVLQKIVNMPPADDYSRKARERINTTLMDII